MIQPLAVPINRARLVPALVGLLFISLGALGRLTALDWDSLAGLHADERHMLFMASAALRGLQDSSQVYSIWSLWFDAASSPLNPRNHSGFYVYGEAPLLFATLLSYVQNSFEWNDILLRGRLISAVADSATIVLVFLIAARWSAGKWVAVAACGFYAALPMAMREAHFFTVDTLSTLFGTAAIYVASGWMTDDNRVRDFAKILLAGGLVGLSVACKPSGAVFLVAIGLVVAAQCWERRSTAHAWLLLQAACFVCAIFVSFRLFNPFAYSGPGFWGLALDARFLDDLAEQARFASAGIGWPPNWYWVDRPVVPSLARDLAFWGIGPGLTACFFLSLAVHRNWRPLQVAGLLFVIFGLVLLCSYPTPALRYALPFMPIVSVLAACVFARASWRGAPLCGALLLAISAIQSWGVLRILIDTHPRVAASAYIWSHVERGSTILNETDWDETLPAVVRLAGDREARWPFTKDAFRLELLGIQEPDSEAKARLMAERLSRADILVESSQRFATTIPRLAKRFPMSSHYYEMLADGSLCFEQVGSFSHGLSVLGLFEIDDSSAQESWLIYDHPTVKLFKRLACFDRNKVEQELLAKLNP